MGGVRITAYRTVTLTRARVPATKITSSVPLKPGFGV
jgi:hypothetical protein